MKSPVAIAFRTLAGICVIVYLVLQVQGAAAQSPGSVITVCPSGACDYTESQGCRRECPRVCCDQASGR